ncbi:MAG: iron ABC transporter permease [Candidatus Tectomicrobia bacterium]|uniref:Iron ABC transporter permease n=1 Tax=Tectimicrobiota bacterium TaxID=2528274 RepID=A0A932GPX3_UNCTE|nr:iron ABC transporter permease [Candidatus Tectomicrobia bacterium]
MSAELRPARIGMIPHLRFSTRHVLLILSTAPAFVILFLVGLILWVGLVRDVNSGIFSTGVTLDHYRALWADPLLYRALFNTAQFALIAMAVAFGMGVPLAWLAERSNLPGKGIIYVLMVSGLLLPGVFIAMGWVFLFHPEIGIINMAFKNLLGLDHSLVNIVSVPGMGIIQGLNLVPVVFITLGPSYRAMNPAVEEAARVHGLSLLGTLRRISLPLLLPSLLGAFLYVITIAIAAFDIPAIIGLSNRILTFSTFVYISANPREGLPNYGLVGAISSVMIVFALLSCWMYVSVLKRSYKYAVVTGQGYSSRLVKLRSKTVVGVWLLIGLYFLFTIVMPLLVLVWASVMRWFQPPSLSALKLASLANLHDVDWSMVLAGAKNSAVLMLVVPTLVLVFGGAIAWIVVRSRFQGKVVLDFSAFVPHAVPHIIFAFSILVAALFLLQKILPIYGKLAILIIVYTLAWLAFGTRVLSSSLVQLHKELEEVGRVSGIPGRVILWKILLPLLRPAILSSWLWMALLTFREFTMAAMLATTRGNITLPIVIWSYWSGGQSGRASAVALIGFLILVPMVAAYWIAGRRFAVLGATRA